MLERMILRILGKEKLSNIHIPGEYKKPRREKMNVKEFHYDIFRKFEQPIVIDEHNTLVDGYTSYLIAKKKNMKYVTVVRWRRW